MKVIGTICFILACAVGLFLALLPAIFTWATLFDSMVGGILFSIFLFPIAILGYPIVILIAGLATGVGVLGSVAAAVVGYILIAATIGLFFLAGWLWGKAEGRESYSS
jgi:hypothetical protein